MHGADRRTFLGAAGALAASVALGARAQSGYPSRVIRIIAPVQPGGGVDLVARTIAEGLTKAFGQSVIVENQSGGGGVVASQAVARATPDGYTLMVGYVGTHGTNPAVRKLPYDAVKDFTPIAMVGGTPNVFVVPPAVPASNLAEFVSYAKANAGELSYGSSGPGTLTHLAMEQFRGAAGIDMTHIAYRGIGPAFVDILAGRTHAMLPGLAAALPHIQAGKVKPLAVTGKARHRLLPDVATFEEQGYKDFDGVQWYGIVGPAKLPADVVQRLNDEINRELGTPELRQKLSSEALDPMPMTPEAFGTYMRNDIAHWSALAKAHHIEITD
ncbi:MAG TPA: tripartite tricarboxylate transporter substrate binding protein [Casimicrobiaceae bacterium]|jgi:tripartite-type tricarboxylate transporter receptor subunit TctC